jgi:hypothetical protein
LSFGGQTDAFVDYRLGTRDGTNPNEKDKPDFEKYRLAASLGMPITSDWSVLGQYSRTAGSANKQKTYVLFNEPAKDESSNDFYRLSSQLQTDYGDLTLEGAYTDYSANWDGTFYRDTHIDVRNKGLTSQLKWERDLGALVVPELGLEKVKLTTRAYYNDSSTINDGGGNETVYRVMLARANIRVTDPSEWFRSTDPSLLSWCREPARFSGTASYCREGDYGYREQGQKQAGLIAAVEGDVALGTFALGGEFQHTDAYRGRDEYQLYQLSKTALNLPAGVEGWTCPPGDRLCSSEQFNSSKTVLPGYRNEVGVNAFNAYLELDQSWKWFDIRAGLRADYDDFVRNLDISPRLAVTYTPFEDLSVTLGANRYYNAESVAYALLDGQPLAYAAGRSNDSDGNVSSDWSEGTGQRYYAFNASGLDTPYKDEFTAAVRYNEPILGGDIRLRYIERRGRDQYLVAEDETSLIMDLTNGGSNRYRSASVEYGKSWNELNLRHLDSVSLSASAVWSKQSTTSQGYVDDEWADRIWYDGRSYSVGEFGLVTGNKDIPVRLAMNVGSNWFEQRLKVGATMNVNLGYEGVRDSDESCKPSPTSAACPLPAGPGVGITHAIFEDFDFKPRFTMDLKASYRLAETKFGAYDVNLAIQNVFNDTSNSIASDETPWLRGRSVWLGAAATF